MSSLFFIAPLLGLFASLFLFGMIRFVAKRNAKHGHALGCAAATIAFPILTVLFFVWLPHAATSTGVGVSAQVANEGLQTFSVPVTATDVNFRHASFGGMIDAADFAIDEQAFLAWSKQNEWKTVRFSTDADRLQWDVVSDFDNIDQVRVTPVPLVSGNRSEDLEVRNGYYFDNYEKDGLDDSGLTVVYDKDRGRAYIWRTTF